MDKHSIKEHPQAVSEALLFFIRSHGLHSAHYFGLADKRVILALTAEPGFELGVTDYYDRWNRTKHFWSDEFENFVGPDDVIPDWLEGISTYQEGSLDTNFLIYDLPPLVNEQASDFHLGEFLGPRRESYQQRIDFVALPRPQPSQLVDSSIKFAWTLRSAGQFGIQKSPMNLRRRITLRV